MGTILVNFN